MSDKAITGKVGLLFNVTKGALIVGTGLVALADNSWFMISSIHATPATSELPFNLSANPLGRVFKTGTTATAITTAIGDNVWPLTFTKVCKTDISISQEKGEIDVTDDYEGGYNAAITDGFTDISGTAGRFMKFDETTGDLSTADEDFLNRFWDIETDDGAGVYTITAKNDDDIYIAYLRNSTFAAATNVQIWSLFPAILTGLSGEGPLKGVQTADLTFKKAQGPAAIYKRITNATESVF